MFVVKDGEARLAPDNWIKTPYACPVCKQPLFYIADRGGAKVWCPWGVCSSIGMNEGGHGSTLEKALAVVLAKNGFAKTYECETVEVVESPNADNLEAPAKVKPEGKQRGRKKRGQAIGPMTIPVGEFTMKQFCTANNTYPVKALAFFKTMPTIKEVARRNLSGGRGKPAVIYLNKV